MTKQQSRTNRKNDPAKAGSLSPARGATTKSSTLIVSRSPEQNPDAVEAEIMVSGVAMNAVTAVRFSSALGGLDLTECVAALTAATRRVNEGELGDAEALLVAQAVALNSIFTELAHRSMMNFSEYPDAGDRYLRLALKAQSQCRATVETLSVMKNPPTFIARQANIAHGHQQVNNGVPAKRREVSPPRAEDSQSGPNELLEAHGERVDGGTSGKAVTGDSHLAPVGAVHRAAKCRG